MAAIEAFKSEKAALSHDPNQLYFDFYADPDDPADCADELEATVDNDEPDDDGNTDIINLVIDDATGSYTNQRIRAELDAELAASNQPSDEIVQLVWSDDVESESGSVGHVGSATPVA